MAVNALKFIGNKPRAWSSRSKRRTLSRIVSDGVSGRCSSGWFNHPKKQWRIFGMFFKWNAKNLKWSNSLKKQEFSIQFEVSGIQHENWYSWYEKSRVCFHFAIHIFASKCLNVGDVKHMLWNAGKWKKNSKYRKYRIYFIYFEYVKACTPMNSKTVEPFKNFRRRTFFYNLTRRAKFRIFALLNT